ncbi:MAG: AsmA family protein [Methylobacter sp.]
MEKPSKIILSTIAITAVLSAVIMVTLPLVIDPNDFKPEIAAAVKDKTGRELVLDGELKLSVFPWFGVETGKAVLNNAPDFPAATPFAALEQSEIRLRLLPLLSKKVYIDRIVLKGLVVNLARNQQGVSNWHDLTESNAALAQSPATTGPQQTQQAPPFPTVEISDIVIENARINWDDLQAGQHIEITDLNLETGKFAFEQPVTLAVSLNARNTASQTSHDVKFNTEFNVNQQLNLFTLNHGELLLSSPGKSLEAQLTVNEAMFDKTQHSGKISGLQLKSGELLLTANLTSTDVDNKPVLQGPVNVAPFSPANFMRQLNIALPSMRDANALNKLALNFDLAATADSADLKNLAMTLDDSQIKGSVAIKNFAQPEIGFTLDIDALDVDRYLKPAEKSSKPLTSPAMMLAAGAAAVPIETLRQLNADGTLTLGRLKANGLFMQDVRIDLNSKNGAIKTQQSVKQFYQGSYSGEISVDARGDKPALAVNDEIERAQIEPLLKDYRGAAKFSGIVNTSAQLQARAGEIKETLNGRFSFMLKDGAIKGFSLQKIIDKGKALLKAPAFPSDNENDQTVFSELSGTATIVNGLIQNNDLVGKASKVRVDGNGSINLNSEALDYTVDAKLLDADDPDPDFADNAVTIKVGGTLDQPSYTIDIASLWNDKNKAKVEKLIDKIDNKLAPGVGNLLKKFLH